LSTISAAPCRRSSLDDERWVHAEQQHTAH